MPKNFDPFKLSSAVCPLLGEATASGFNGTAYFDCLHNDLVRSAAHSISQTLTKRLLVVVMCNEDGRATGNKCRLQPREDTHRVAARLLREAWAYGAAVVREQPCARSCIFRFVVPNSGNCGNNDAA